MGHEREGISLVEKTGFVVVGAVLVGEGLCLFGVFNKQIPTDIIDCGNGRQGSIDLILPKNDSFSMSTVDGNNNIYFENKADGSLTIYFNDGNKTIDLSGETVTVSQIDLQPGEKVSFEDNGAQIDITETPADNGNMNVQISGTCKK